MRYLWLGVLMAALAACASMAERTGKYDEADIARCTELGFTPGTDAFGECRLKLVEIRQAKRNAILGGAIASME